MESINEQEFPISFINKLVAIFEHSEEEIIELLKSKPVPVLKQLRDLTFSELVNKLPKYAERELYARRKGELLAEDIYVFGFSAINALPDRRLTQCLKPLLDLDSTSLSEHEPNTVDNGDIQSLTELCIELQEKVKNLQETVKVQTNRITALETQITVSAQDRVTDSTTDDKLTANTEKHTDERPDQPKRTVKATQTASPQSGEN